MRAAAVAGCRRVFLLTASVLAAGCGDATDPQNPEDVNYDASLGINLAQMTKLPSGVYIQTVTAGSGTAAVTSASLITADYKGSLTNGSVFDSGRLNNLQVSLFIPGFTDGVIGMKVGEVRKIVIPSRLAYGDNPPSGIPRNAVLVFEISLVQFTG